jgi:hypothetical protein
LREKNQLKFCCRAALAEKNFTGCIFGDMLFQFLAPQRLKCMAAAIQGFESGSIGAFTAQITPLNLMRRYACILGHAINTLFRLPVLSVDPVDKGKLSIFYWTGLTGFTGYFFGFPDESQKFQSPSANEKKFLLN